MYAKNNIRYCPVYYRYLIVNLIYIMYDNNIVISRKVDALKHVLLFVFIHTIINIHRLG